METVLIVTYSIISIACIVGILALFVEKAHNKIAF
jgi:hypothetical protein